MSSVATLQRFLAFFGSTLVVCNIIVNLLDLATTFIGFSRGLPEQNVAAAAVMREIGNEYVGGIVIKSLYIGFFIFAFYAIRAVGRMKQRFIACIALICFNILLGYAALIIFQIALDNAIYLRL